MRLKTVLIEWGKGFVEINESDFNPEKHTLYTGEIPSPEPEKPTGINLNTASFNEIKSLPTVGIAIARKIIDNRPYTSLEDLPEEVDKKAIVSLVCF